MNQLVRSISVVLYASFLLFSSSGSVAAINDSDATGRVRVALAGDALNLDPHSFNETNQLALLGNVYEGLLVRDQQLRLKPGLAVKWRAVSPTKWRFELRRNVRFHGGEPFTATDVVFSLQRARQPEADMSLYVADVTKVAALDSFTVEVETRQPNPTLPETLPLLYILPATWAKTIGLEKPIDIKAKATPADIRTANGTGPYRLEKWTSGISTTLTRNDSYWGAIAGSPRVVEIVQLVNDSTRMAALLANDVDIAFPLPSQDVERLSTDARVVVTPVPELRNIFLGLDVERAELLYSDVKNQNPFKDRRVRQAVAHAIDVVSIVKNVMRNQARASGTLIAKGVRGYDETAAQPIPFSPERSKSLLREAGFPNGFAITLDCSNDRYLNDSQVCQSIVPMLQRVGLRVRLNLMPRAQYFPKIVQRDTSMFLLGWYPPTNDVHHLYHGLTMTKSPDEGQQNMSGYSNPYVDRLVRQLAVETDETERQRIARRVQEIVKDDLPYIPLYQQILSAGTRKGLSIAMGGDAFFRAAWVRSSLVGKGATR